MQEHFFLVRRVGEFAGQVLRGEVEILVQVAAPLWAIGHVVDEAAMRDPLAGPALAVVAAEFGQGDDAVGDVHEEIITAGTWLIIAASHQVNIEEI